MNQPRPDFDLGKDVRKVNLDTLSKEEVATWKSGETLLLSGKLLTGRDAAHKRMTDMLDRGESLPVALKGRFIYYVGPVDPVRDEVVGPAGPTTATRMDKFTRTMLEKTGLIGMVGKAERGPAAIEAIRDNQAVYLMAVGGAFLSMAQFNAFTFGVISGRGWVCIALVVFGQWSPWRSAKARAIK